MALSDTAPVAPYLRGGKRIFPFNVATKQVTDPQTGKTRTQYEYEEWEMGIDSTDEQIAAEKLRMERQSSAKKDYKLLTVLAGKNDAQIAVYVDDEVIDLASAKVLLRILARAVVALARGIGVD